MIPNTGGRYEVVTSVPSLFMAVVHDALVRGGSEHDRIGQRRFIWTLDPNEMVHRQADSQSELKRLLQGRINPLQTKNLMAHIAGEHRHNCKSGTAAPAP